MLVGAYNVREITFFVKKNRTFKTKCKPKTKTYEELTTEMQIFCTSKKLVILIQHNCIGRYGYRSLRSGVVNVPNT